jgi:uncharacterized protein (TIGR02217 family)
MTSLVYPTLPGLTFDVVRTPMWHTEAQRALSGKRSTFAYMLYPLIHFELTYSWLNDQVNTYIATSALKQLVGLFNQCMGQYDTFLFNDPDFNTVLPTAPQQFGVGDGATKLFQIVAFYQNAGGPGYGEIVQNFSGAPTIYLNGVAQAGGYILGPTLTIPAGAVQFTNAPGNGVVISWSGSFLYRCAFDEDKLDLTKFMNQWWSAKKVPFTSVKL